ncbi:MAG: hypothetical protein K9J37_19645 [Saprospiraceae bacterium]|nr:hypothetical protein [Saprospiraceae bacterium]MCF8252140.1 hypothetical protein [Saprospiraceae bacterium]MCF8282451.1 hypothetical protein [Bacteroidales bacterium]MCF8313809.1 hypothetical protein [Saprospiraceae bacterium]MCF8442515.1 hypothetical protein [Saprospiraceae bacterium]
MSQTSNNPPNDFQKFWLALLLLVLCLGGIIVLAIVVMKYAGGGNAPALDAAKSIFNSVLPLLGAWIGSIIAYYFGTKQAEATIRQLENTNKLLQEQAQENLKIAQSALKSQQQV